MNPAPELLTRPSRALIIGYRLGFRFYSFSNVVVTNDEQARAHYGIVSNALVDEVIPVLAPEHRISELRKTGFSVDASAKIETPKDPPEVEVKKRSSILVTRDGEYRQVDQAAVRDLGTTEGIPATNGFVFIDGKYIEAPYIVTRQGNGIFINGHLVEQPLILRRKTAEWTRATVLVRTDEDRANYEDRLNKGDYYFLGSAHGRMTGTADGARMVLGTLLPILKTSKTATEVEERMVAAGFTWFDDQAAQAFFAHRDDLKDLEARVEKLKTTKPKENGDIR